VPEVDWDACFTSVEAQAEFRKKYTEALRQTPDEANERRLMDPEQFEEEERKRNVAYDPVQRWLHIQQTITWVEAGLVLPNRGAYHDWKESGPKGERASAKPGRLSAVPLGTKVKRGG